MEEKFKTVSKKVAIDCGQLTYCIPDDRRNVKMAIL